MHIFLCTVQISGFIVADEFDNEKTRITLCWMHNLQDTDLCLKLHLPVLQVVFDRERLTDPEDGQGSCMTIKQFVFFVERIGALVEPHFTRIEAKHCAIMSISPVVREVCINLNPPALWDKRIMMQVSYSMTYSKGRIATASHVCACLHTLDIW